MAIYHLTVKNISRTRRSTIASLGYRAGVNLTDPQTGESFDYSSKEVDGVELYIQDNAPQWLQDLQKLIKDKRTEGVQKLSDIAEAAEKRIDARVYKEVEFAIPKELSLEERKKLGDRFMQKNLADQGIVTLGNFHDLESDKPHCHAMLITRKADETGLEDLKNPELYKKSFLKNLRLAWEVEANAFLQEHGYEARIDHRSHKARGIALEPQPKLGKNVQEMESALGGDPKNIFSKTYTEKGKDHQEVKLRNFYKIIKDPDIILRDVCKQQTTFMWGDVAKYLAKHIDDQALFERILLKLEASKELVCVQKGEFSSQSIFTTKARLLEEKNFVDVVARLKNNDRHSVNERSIESAMDRANADLRMTLKDHSAGLSQDQVEAVHHMASPSQISLVEGYAGAGKTTVMRIMKEIWEENSYAVYGLAPTGRAADNLADCDIKSVTIHSFLKTYREGRNQLKESSVLVLDEAGMVDSKCFAELMIAVECLGVKLVACGDNGQLSPVEAGVPFRLAVEGAGKAELTTVLRQKIDWQKEATVLFGEGNAKEALRLYGGKGRIITVAEELPEDIVERYNLTRRIAGNISHAINQDLEQAHKDGEYLTLKGHPDYHVFKKWKNLRDEATATIFKDLERYKPQLQAQGVDGLDFAQKLINHPAQLVGGTDKHELSTKLGIDWRIDYTHTCDPRLKTKERLARDWFKSTHDRKEEVQAMMAHSNKDVVSLNDAARSLKKSSGEIGETDFIFTIERNGGEELGETKTEEVERSFSLGDQILFTKNDKGLGISNGTLGRITKISPSTIHALIGKGEEAREVSFSPNLYKNFDNGWAVTLHKNQGVTVDRSFVLGSYEQYKNLSYVGMTRHSKDAHLYASDFDFWTQEKIYERLARSQDKLSSLDYIKLEEAYSLIKSNSKNMGDTLKKVGQNIEAIGYVTQKGWDSISDKFMGYTPKRNRIRVQGSLLADVKSEADRADELLEKKKKEKEVQGKAPSTELQIKKPNPFVYGSKKSNPFKVNQSTKNPFEGGGFGK